MTTNGPRVATKDQLKNCCTCVVIIINFNGSLELRIG